jgi:hypothetical protein
MNQDAIFTLVPVIGLVLAVLLVAIAKTTKSLKRR